MKFALRRLPEEKDFTKLAERCRSAGRDGVELNCCLDLSADLGRALTDAGLHISCISIPAPFTEDDGSDAESATQILACLDLARHLQCHLIRIPAPQPRKRESVMSTISAMADWLLPLATAAGDRGVVIAVENGPAFPTARPLWLLMERLDHSAVGVYWNTEISLAAGESVAVTIPTLNSRIRYVHMNHENPEALTRLRGIGYQGWINLADG